MLRHWGGDFTSLLSPPPQIRVDPSRPGPCLGSRGGGIREAPGFQGLCGSPQPGFPGRLRQAKHAPSPAPGCGLWEEHFMGSGRTAAGWGNPKGRLPPPRSWGFLSLCSPQLSGGRGPRKAAGCSFPLPGEKVLRAAAELCTRGVCWVVFTLV